MKIKKDLCEAQIRREERSIQNDISTLDSQFNPFTYEEDRLINIVSGVLACDNIQRHLKTAQDTGENVMRNTTIKFTLRKTLF